MTKLSKVNRPATTIWMRSKGLLTWASRRWFGLMVCGFVIVALFGIRSVPDLIQWWRANPDRELGQFLLGLGGSVRINNVQDLFEKPGALPLRRFAITQANLANTKLTDAGARRLAGRKDLFEVDVRKTNLHDESVRTFASLRNLRRLDLTRTFISTEAARDLQRRLPDCAVIHSPDDAAARYFFGKKLLREVLVEVDMSSSGTRGQRRCRRESELPEQRLTILELDLSATEATNLPRVSNEDLRYLHGLRHISALKLDGAEITDRATRLLKTLTSLRKLSLRGTGLSNDAVEELRTTLTTTVTEM